MLRLTVFRSGTNKSGCDEQVAMKKIGFVAALIVFGLAMLSTRYYMVDLPVYHFLGGGEGPEPAALHLEGEFVESNLGAAEKDRRDRLRCA